MSVDQTAPTALAAPPDTDPRDAVAALGDRTGPYLLGVRHHSPALAVVLPALLDAAGVDVVCVELPTDFQRWLPHLADPELHAPVALAGARPDGPLGFYPFADFSPELAAIRWARQRDVPVVCCDLPMADPGWAAGDDAPRSGAETGRGFADALTAAGTGRDGDDMWDRAVEVLAPGCPPDAVRRAALGVGWALRQDALARGGISRTDLAREAHMRTVIGNAGAGGRRVAAVVGAFHAPALAEPGPATEAGSAPDTVVTSLVPYGFDLLDSRSGYPAGIRDPRWQQAVHAAGGDPDLLRQAAARAVTELCRELRAAGHPAGTGEAVETVRLADDLARLRGLPAPGRGELLEAVTTVLGQGELLGRGRAVARALGTVLVGAERGRIAPGTPRSGLGPAVEAELAALRLPGPGDTDAKDLRLDPFRSDLDRRREILLRRLRVCGVGYGEPVEVAGVGDGSAVGTRWRLTWTPAVPALLDLAGVRGVTAAQAAAGTLRETFRRETADGGATCAQILDELRSAAECDLPELVATRLSDAAEVLPSAATLPELVQALDLLDTLSRGHLPGAGPDERARATDLSHLLLETAVRALPGLAGTDRAEDARALVALAVRAGDQHRGLRIDQALGHLTTAGSPLAQGAALAARTLLDLDPTDTLGTRCAGWVDAAGGPDGRRRLTGLLSGVLTAAAPLLETAPAALDPLLDRIDALSDRAFLDRLPALRGGFDTLDPAGRRRMLDVVTGRTGDRLDLALSVPPAVLARWTAADAAGSAALHRLGPVPPAGSGAADGGAGGAPDADRDATRTRETRGGLGAPDRWRLILGQEKEKLPVDARGYAHALDELYGAGRGEGSLDLRADGDRGGQDTAFPTARDWADQLDALFGADVREEVLGRAADAGRHDVLTELDPGSVRPSIELLTSVLSLAGGMPEERLAKLRPLVRRLVEELTRQLATRLRPALSGLATPRPTRRPGGRLDLPRTVRANLMHTRRIDGRTVVVPERPVFTTRAHRASDWRLVLVVDVSGSMEASVIWSALTAAVLGGVPSLSTHFLAFSTRVIDLTDQVSDPLSLLLEVRVGGGTHIAAGLAHARSLVTVPSRTLVVVVSDFEEGYPLGGLLNEVRALASSGVRLMGCAALDDTGTPRYSVPVAQQLVAAGMPVAALSPLALAQWVGDCLRGER
ncbi:vWA domain-containing protein [Actinocatenispora rupis]|uniref:VWA domain containing CoxE-like protein n=1 Tax=Actinocatenispora rupis TaxID=519421 RepID=A0A8J3NF90_9ACTN|nr:DUF5682 family protein [Actinocatenispora rupis]GID14645.1 hypothetical protein Aru02nite_55340 [Actinocatenispora rupis]